MATELPPAPGNMPVTLHILRHKSNRTTSDAWGLVNVPSETTAAASRFQAALVEGDGGCIQHDLGQRVSLRKARSRMGSRPSGSLGHRGHRRHGQEPTLGRSGTGANFSTFARQVAVKRRPSSWRGRGRPPLRGSTLRPAGAGVAADWRRGLAHGRRHEVVEDRRGDLGRRGARLERRPLR